MRINIWIITCSGNFQKDINMRGLTMTGKTGLLIVCLISILFGCEKKQNIEKLFHEAEKLEPNILKSLDTIAKYRDNYEKILVEVPKSGFAPSACYKLGKLNEIFGHHTEAIEYYRKLLSNYPEHPFCADGLLNTGQIYQEHLKKTEEAVTAYNQLLSFYPESDAAFQALLQLGQLSSRNEKWKEAIDYFQMVVARYPEDKICDDLCFRIADIMQVKMADKQKAIQMFQDLIENYPNSTWIKHAKTRLVALTQGGAEDEK